METMVNTYRWFVIYLLWMTHALQALSQSSLAVAGPLIKREWNLSNVEFGTFFGMIALGSVVAHIPAGILCDKYSIRNTLSLGMFLIGLGLLLFSIPNSLIYAYGMLFLLGLGTGLIQVSATKSVIDWFSRRGRATAMGIKQTGINCGAVGASLVIPLLIATFGWLLLFRYISYLILGFSLFFYLFYRDAASDSIQTETGRVFNVGVIANFLRDRGFRSGVIAGFILILVQMSFSSYFVLYLTENLNYSVSMAGYMFAISFGVGAGARIGWSFLTDFFFKSRKTALIMIGTFGSLTMLILGLLPFLPHRTLIYVLSILSGLTAIGWNAVWLTFMGETSKDERMGLALGLSFFITSLGSIIGPMLFGYLVDLFNSYMAAWFFLAFFMGLVSIVFLH